jgi:hypothetical protein
MPTGEPRKEHTMGTIGEVVRVRVIPVPDRGPEPEPVVEVAADAHDEEPSTPQPVLVSHPRP